MDSPKKHMLEEDILAGSFIFVSYSHTNIELVTRDVVAWHERGVRVWYDYNMEETDNWREVAQATIKHPNCRAVLFYNSAASFVSNACNEERLFVLEKIKQDSDFKYWIINVDDKTTEELFNSAMSEAALKNKGLEFMSRFAPGITQLFQDEIIRVSMKDNAHIDRMVEKAAQYGMLDNVGFASKQFQRSNMVVDEKPRSVKFGVYKNQKMSTPLSHREANERFNINEHETYISHNNVLFTTKPLYWDLIDVRNDVAVLLCTQIVDECKGGDCVVRFLQEVFPLLAFTAEERKLLHASPRLLSLYDIENFQGSAIPPINGVNQPFGTHFWIDAAGVFPDWQMTCKSNVVYKKGFLNTNVKGVRPVIEISMAQLNSLK